MTTRTLLLVFRATATPTASRPHSDDPEVLEIHWFRQEAALETITHPSEHDRLSDALANTPDVAYRVYR